MTEPDCDVLSIEAAARRFFVEPKLGALASGQGRVDPVAMFGSGHDELALCRRLGIAGSLVADRDVARLWRRDAPAAAEDVALASAASRLMLWAHGASFLTGKPDAFFETLLPLREKLIELEATRPEVKVVLASRSFGRAGSFASYYREYRVRRDAGEEDVRWLTFEEGLSYV
jgi:hypothetical protein